MAVVVTVADSAAVSVSVTVSEFVFVTVFVSSAVFMAVSEAVLSTEQVSGCVVKKLAQRLKGR